MFAAKSVTAASEVATPSIIIGRQKPALSGLTLREAPHSEPSVLATPAVPRSALHYPAVECPCASGLTTLALSAGQQGQPQGSLVLTGL